MDKNLIDELKKDNPYPEDIFTPLKDEEIKSYVSFLIEHGLSSERIHAHWMRISWNNCVDQLKERLQEQEE